MNDKISEKFRREVEKELGVLVPEDSFLLAYDVQWYQKNPMPPLYEFPPKNQKSNYVEFLSHKNGRIRIEPTNISPEFLQVMSEEMKRLYESIIIGEPGS